MITANIFQVKKVRVAALMLAAACALTFVGCSDAADESPTTPTDTNTSTTETPDGVDWKPLTSLDQIQVSETEFGTEPEVTFETPLKADTTLISTLVQGTGVPVRSTGLVAIYYAGYNTRDGVKFDGNFGTSPSANYANGFITGFSKALEGQAVGSRILVAITSSEGYPDGNTNAGINPGDTLVFVIDLVDGQYYEPNGAVVADGNDYATVTDQGGVPVPAARPGVAAPTETVATTLIQSDNPRPVMATDYVILNYVEVNYNTGEILSGSYGGDNVVVQLDMMIPGWQKGLVGQSVGSRVLLVVPPADAYPDGDPSRNLPADQPLIFVVDILYAVLASSE
ncbi:MAG: FKBP-type peptidyl-prolyl cis-trans isomerase [Propionibacteriaceae bacterium]|jgi:peptidylprolyl isomerase|nr:FKBP-type peptidyl-prolyl cis-trans isomerase [Propionibacteriaceae bacterium]